MKSEEPSTLSIVVGTDFDDASGYAFDEAARLAQRAPKSQLHLVHVFDEQPSPARSRELIGHIRLYVNEKTAQLGGLPGVTIGIHLRSGRPAREIAQLATDVGAALIVVGANTGPHLKDWIKGSAAEGLVGNSPCPVLVAWPRPVAVQHEPTIEPACPDCVHARTISSGTTWWCERHSHHAKRAHTFSYQRELPFESHDSEVIPTGIEASLV